MKLTTVDNLKKTEPYNSKHYVVTSPRQVTTVIDHEENIIDLFPYAAMKYKIDEAEEFVEFLKATWKDYENDPYYKQCYNLYPIYQSTNALKDVELKKFTDTLTVYRYQVAGEYIYGITTRWTEKITGDRKKAVEAPMDGWEKWLKDRQNMLKDKWIADNLGNL